MPIHVTIDPVPSEDGLTVEQIAACLLQLKPASIDVDCAGPGRVVLASLQAKGLPAKALEKRPRPTLPDVERAEAESRRAAALKTELEQCEREKKLLEESLRLLRILIERLD